MILNYLQSGNITVLIISAIVMVMALIFHNIVQAWVASRYGDNSPRFAGFMRFDPQQQLEPFGVLFLFLLGFGWPKMIPVNSRNYRGRGQQEAIVWYSGPAAYLLVGFVCVLIASILRAAGASQDLFIAFIASASYATLHAVINLFPVYPLDGAKAALVWGGPGVRRVIQQIAQYGLLGFIVVFMVLNLLGITSGLQNFFLRLFAAIVEAIPGL